MTTRGDVLVSAAALRTELEGPRAPVLLDVRWALGDPDGHAHYLQSHLPGAVFVDLENEFAAHPESLLDGRHPLPTLEVLESAARRWGVSSSSPIVAYDGVGGLSAARAWWLLRWAGVSSVRILDGGLAAWTRAGFPTYDGDVAPPPGDVVLSGDHQPVISAEQAAAFPKTGVLLDARAAERYRGEVEPVDSRAGHIPGALSAPTAGNLNDVGTFASTDKLRSRFADLGVTPDAAVGVYCGSGVTAAHEIAALAIAGVDAALYPGSWSAWSADPERPVATTAEVLA